jgi:mono/diheme cytochrome c family protein
MKVSRRGSRRAWMWAATLGFILLGSGAVRTSARPPQDDDWKAPDSAKKVKNPVPANAASLAAGKQVYANNCDRCHGDMGKGDGSDANLYDPGPTDFTDASTMQGMSDGELFYKITEGRRPMPSFKKDLNEQQRWQVVNYLRTFSKK